MTGQSFIILLNQHSRWQDNLLLFFWTNTRNDRTKSNCSSEPTRRFLIILLNQRAENKQSHHLNVKCSDTTLLSNNITTKINNPSSECQACRYNTSYTQHYDENKQSHYPSVERAENKQSHHRSVKRADTNTCYKQHYDKNKQSHHLSVKRADMTLLTNNVITKINNHIIRLPSVQIRHFLQTTL